MIFEGLQLAIEDVRLNAWIEIRLPSFRLTRKPFPHVVITDDYLQITALCWPTVSFSVNQV
jgi:hypothetical protein